MPKKTILANEELAIKTSGKYLSIINASHQFYVESPEFGRLAGIVGRKFHVEGIPLVNIVNESNDILELEYESANIKVDGDGNAAVNVVNEVVVKRIVEPQKQTVAVSGIDDGKMRRLVSNELVAPGVVTVPAKSRIKLISANENTNRKVTLQNISESRTELWLGGALIDANQGSYFAGSIDAPASDVIENEAALYAYNNSDTAATVAIREEYRA